MHIKEDIQQIKKCIEKGDDIESKSNSGYTPLHIASWSGNIEIVKFLLEQGADIESKNKNRDTPLNIALSYGRIEIVKFLLEQGADIESKRRVGKDFTRYLNKEQKEEIGNLVEDIRCRKEMIKDCRKI